MFRISPTYLEFPSIAILLFNLAGESVWIGLNDIAEEGVFVWTDGSPNTYTRFFGNDPDNYQDKEDCGVIVKSGGGLRDMACDGTYTFICETKYPSL